MRYTYCVDEYLPAFQYARYFRRIQNFVYDQSTSGAEILTFLGQNAPGISVSA
jgi:hypothetical protein